MRKLIFTNRKGGSGKTTVAINLAVALARKKKRILFADLDSQAHATFFFTEQNDVSLQTVLSYLKKEASSEQLLKKTRYERISLLPSDQKMAQINELIADDYHFLKRLFSNYEKDFDFLLIDVPPSLEKVVICGMAACNEVLIPLQMHFLPLKGVSQLFQLVFSLNKEINPVLKISGFIPTLYNERTRIYRSVLEELAENFPPEMVLPGIPYDIRLAEAPSFRQSIFEYAPKSKAAEAFGHLITKILSMEG